MARLLKLAGNISLIQECIRNGMNLMTRLEWGPQLYYRRGGPGLRKLIKENEKLKKLLAEKKLENALLS
ncbi:MAG: hypothetical protein QXU18_07325 [Thermoplasmatales archaeon]